MALLVKYRVRPLLVATVLFALAAPGRAAEVNKYLPSDTAAVAVVNIRQLLDSPLVKKYALEHLKSGLKNEDEAVRTLESLGFDPFKDLKQITIALTSVAPEPKGLFIAEGQFDLTKLEARAEKEAENHGDVLKIHKEGEHKIYEVKMPDAPQAFFIGFLNKTATVIATKKDAVANAFAVAGGKKQNTIGKDLEGLIKQADADQSFWFAVSGAFPRDLAADADDRAKKQLEKLDTLTSGMTVDTGVKFHMTMVTKSTDAAKEIADKVKEHMNQLKGLLAIAGGQGGPLEQAVPLIQDAVNSIQATTDGAKIMVKGEISGDDVEKRLKKGQ